VQLRYAAFTALIIGLALVSNQVLAANTPATAPTSVAATCISGFTPTPATWNSKSAPSYVCKSDVPTCPNGLHLTNVVRKPDVVGSTGAHAAPHAYFSYKCAVAAASPAAQDDWESPSTGN
jgi:hypothetical protein